MATSVNLYHSGVKPTGKQILVDQYEMNLKCDWTTSASAAKTATQRILFPDILKSLPKEYIDRMMHDAMVEYMRQASQVDKETEQAVEL